MFINIIIMIFKKYLERFRTDNTPTHTWFTGGKYKIPQENYDGFINTHPLVEEKYMQGCLYVIYHLQEILKALTGLDATTLQPAAGAHGELTGMLLIHRYNKMMGGIYFFGQLQFVSSRV